MTAKNDASENIQNAVAELAEALRGALLAYQDSGATYVPRYRGPDPRHVEAKPLRSAERSARREDVRPASAHVPAAEADGSQTVKEEVVRPAVSAKPQTTDAHTPQPASDADARRTDGMLLQLIERTGTGAEKLEELERDILGNCRRCKLHRGRTRVVFGSGNPSAELVFVGEGPGAEEDRQGLPFVGAAGQLLTRMIEAMGYPRDEVYICNVVKCRPPNNRDPEPDEVRSCERFLKAQLAIVQPKVIITLGKYAAQTLLRSDQPISRLRGSWHAYEGVALLPTFHPAYLLRSPEKKREAWQDLQKVMVALGRTPTR